MTTTYTDKWSRPNEHYRPDIDGLRAVAILSVLGFHAFPQLFPGGFVGVDVFFVISGYLISGVIFRELQQKRFSITTFYARRVRRIFPALIAMIPVVLALSWPVLLWDEFQSLGKDVVAGAGFVSNLVFYGDSNWYFFPRKTPLLHLWSLGVEEQFYIVWPFFLLLIWRWRWRCPLIVAVTMLSFCLNIVALSYDLLASFYLPTSRLWELSVGALLSYVTLGQAKTVATSTRRLCNHWSAIGGAALLATSFWMLNEKLDFPGWWVLLPCAGALLLIYAGPESWVSRKLLASPPMVFIGLISYPLYVWHWPLLSIARSYDNPHLSQEVISLAAIGSAVVLATLTWKYVELPIRSIRATPRTALTLVGTMAVCGSVGLLVFTQIIAARPASAQVRQFIQATRTDWLPGTNVAWTYEPPGFLEVGRGTKRTLFIGDSHLEQIYPRISKLVAEHPNDAHQAVFAVRAACAPFAVERLRSSAWTTRCRELVHHALQYAQDAGVDTVVIGANWPYYLADKGLYLAHHPVDTLLVLRQLGTSISDLRAKGKRVYVVLDMPMSPGLDPRQMIRRNLVAPGFSVSVNREDRASLESNIGQATSEVRRVATQSGAIVIDEMAWLCAQRTCPAVTAEGVPIYHDLGHLNPIYARESARYLDETVFDPDNSAVAQMPVKESDRDIVNITGLR